MSFFSFDEVVCHDVATVQSKKAQEAWQKVVTGTFSHPETFPQFEQFIKKTTVSGNTTRKHQLHCDHNQIYGSLCNINSHVWPTTYNSIFRNYYVQYIYKCFGSFFLFRDYMSARGCDWILLRLISQSCCADVIVRIWLLIINHIFISHNWSLAFCKGVSPVFHFLKFTVAQMSAMKDWMFVW